MENRNPVKCPENEPVLAYLLGKRKEMAESEKGISDNLKLTFTKAQLNISNCKTPIVTPKDLSNIKGVGKWILKQMKGYFNKESDASESDQLAEKGKKRKVSRQYMPQKNSVAYALLITLFREMESGAEFMHKKELIEAADASGLSRLPVAPEKAKGITGHFGTSSRDWYTGWCSMTTLINKGLVVKSSCPAKYMVTDQGKVVARECLSRSGLSDGNKNLDSSNSNANEKTNLKSNQVDRVIVDLDEDSPDVNSIGATVGQTTQSSITPKKPKKLIDVLPEYIDKCAGMGFSEQDIHRALSEAAKESPGKELTSLWPTVLFFLREGGVYGSSSVATTTIIDQHPAPPSCQGQEGFCASKKIEIEPHDTTLHISQKPLFSSNLGQSACTSGAGLSTDHAVINGSIRGSEWKPDCLMMPPLTSGQKFDDVYEVVLILDNREQFTKKGSSSTTLIDSICSQYKIQIEVRCLPVGDAIWIARHKYRGSEYVLDFIVERKKVDDLRTSIMKDNRYKNQKMRLVRCGLKKMIYLLEGDPNFSEAAESIKTACFTTEILDGFDVQRTAGLADTMKRYGYLTQAINQYYRDLDLDGKFPGVCPTFDEFIQRCKELDKMTVSDVFAIQLMQVPQVTENVALAVVNMYPTLLSLASDYSLLDGDITAQEEMLKMKSKNVISGPASKNIFQLVWGS